MPSAKSGAASSILHSGVYSSVGSTAQYQNASASPVRRSVASSRYGGMSQVHSSALGPMRANNPAADRQANLFQHKLLSPSGQVSSPSARNSAGAAYRQGALGPRASPGIGAS
eukprot:gene17836-24220_t